MSLSSLTLVSCPATMLFSLLEVPLWQKYWPFLLLLRESHKNAFSSGHIRNIDLLTDSTFLDSYTVHFWLNCSCTESWALVVTKNGSNFFHCPSLAFWEIIESGVTSCQWAMLLPSCSKLGLHGLSNDLGLDNLVQDTVRQACYTGNIGLSKSKIMNECNSFFYA